LRQRGKTTDLRNQHQSAIEIVELTSQLSTANSQLENVTKEFDDAKIISSTVQANFNKLETEKAVIDSQVERLPDLEIELNDLRSRLITEQKRSTEFQTRLEEQTRSGEEKLKLLKEAKEVLTTEFQNIGQKIFEEKTEKFTHQNKTNLESLLNPFRDQMSAFKQKVDDVYDKEAKDRVALSEQVKQLRDLNQQLSQDAVNLTRALKGDSKARGNWGEVILSKVLERSGLKEGREYEVQETHKNEEGSRFQPDVVIHLPESKDIVVDSKVSLVAYENFSTTEDEKERATALQQHIASIRAHVRDLSGKNYEELKGLRTLGYVLMFIPIEPAFLLAVGEDPELFNDAMSKNIFIVSPSNLLITLKTINAMWQYAYQNENALEIAQKAGGMYDKFVSFVESFDLVGSRLEQAEESWSQARGQLVTGKGNLVKRADDLKQMGVRTKKQLPSDFVSSSGDDGV
ncbi:MAG: DNA recombination protein RmuC, partial [Alphaproteobacteria bacterium]